MLRVAVCEDQENFLETMLSYLRRFEAEQSENIEIAVFRNGMEMEEGYRPDFDIILMDIDMPYVDGMTAARRIRSVDENVVIIFVTSLAKFAVDGYTVGALDYVLKPVSYAAFSVKMRRASAVVSQRAKKYLFLPLEDRKVRVSMDRIDYVEVDKHYVRIHAHQEEYVMRISLRDFADNVKGEPFVIINSGTMVNLRNVQKFTATSVTVSGVELPLSRSQRKHFQQSLSDYIGKGGL